MLSKIVRERFVKSEASSQSGSDIQDISSDIDAYIKYVKKNRINMTLRLVALLLSVAMAIQWWNYSPCKQNRDLKTCRAHNAVIVSQMIRIIGRIILVAALILQVCHLFNRSVMPFLGTGAILAATFGYLFLHQIYEMVAGLVLLLSNDIEIGDRAVLHVSWVDPSPVVTIDNFHLSYIEASYIDKDTQEIRRIFAYYSKIHQIVKA